MATVKDLLAAKASDLWTIGPDHPIREALNLMNSKNIGALPVVENDKVVGIFSERDFARHATAVDCFDMETLVSELMVHPVYFVDPTANRRGMHGGDDQQEITSSAGT